jgi:methylmalonyl-CoA/ethylmalonyl-CoA epimerase
MNQRTNQANMSEETVGVVVDEVSRSAGRSPKPGIIRLDHVAIAVPDLEKAIKWYSTNLGFKVLARRLTRGERTGMLSAVIACGGVVVVLIQGTEPASQVSRFIEKFGPGVQHLAFGVRNLGVSIEGVKNGNGALDTPVLSDVGIRQVFLRREEGSGVRIELIQRSGGDFSDESVSRLFRAFEAGDLY